MKNSTWFDYKNGQSIESYLTEKPAAIDLQIVEWDCRWCCCKNAVGLDVCERCGMPR